MDGVVTNSAGEISIKSKERVNKFGEVFTPSNIVKDMLDLEGVKEYSYTFDKTFLEPACGNGNFLVEILARKLSCLDSLVNDDKDNWAMHMLQAVSTIYGVDIQEDNVFESRERMTKIILDKYEATYGSEMPSGLKKCVNAILVNNILCGNFLTETFESGTSLFTKRGKDSGETVESPIHSKGDVMTVIEWNFDFENKKIKAKAFTLEEIKNESKDFEFEYEEAKYNQILRAKKVANGNSFDALGI